MTTKREKEHLARVAALDCVLCKALGMPQQGRTCVHHVRDGQGMAQRSSHWLTVALCESCHQGPSGAHGDRSLLRAAKLTEIDLLALALCELFR